MDHMAIAERRGLRRKLSFWRILALVFLAGIGFALYRAASSDEGAAGRPHVARVHIAGLITDDSELLARLKRIAESDNARALVVSISSTGGTTHGGERVFKAIRKIAEKKPVVSDIRTVAASAGYMIATAGDHIVSGESSITGSIGVIFQYPQMEEMLKKIGFSLEAIKSGALKAEPSPFHPASEEAKAMIGRLVSDSHEWFVDLVAERRQLPREDVARLADGSIFTGRQALGLKLVDVLGDDEDIRAYLKTREIDEKLPIVEWKAPRPAAFRLANAFAALLRGAGLDVGASQDALRALGAEKLFLDGLVSVWQGRVIENQLPARQ